jgi:putative SOS response-associated peptidase YedK
MCGLYSLKTSAAEVRAFFGYPEQADFPPRDYVAPTQPIAIVRNMNGARQFALVRWGFVPSWAKQIQPGKPLINARAETVAEKPSFRTAFKRRRCLIPADGFYEWQGDTPGKKQPYLIHRPDGGLFALAGIWEHWLAPDGSELETAAIVTTSANRTLTRVHHRMPVVITPENFDTWLTTPETETDAVRPLLAPAPNDHFTLTPTTIARPGRPAKPPAARKPAPAPGQLKLF